MKKLYGAFDLHSSNNYLGISDEKDRRVYKKRLSNQPDVILAELEPYRSELVGPDVMQIQYANVCRLHAQLVLMFEG